MAVINREWHLAHRMPTKPTPEQRAEWHAEHHDACACRAPSEKEAALIAAWRKAHPEG